MNKNEITSTRRRQLNSNLQKLRSALPKLPKKGWIAEIRSALMLTTTQLARRVNLSQSTISHLESSERDGSITLTSLNKLANAMNCEVVYAFLPTIPLDEQVENQAEKTLLKTEQELNHTMALEDQLSDENKLSIRHILRREMLIQKLGCKIWDVD